MHTHSVHGRRKKRCCETTVCSLILSITLDFYEKNEFHILYLQQQQKVCENNPEITIKSNIILS